MTAPTPEEVKAWLDGIAKNRVAQINAGPHTTAMPTFPLTTSEEALAAAYLTLHAQLAEARERIEALEAEAALTGDEGPLRWQVTRGSGLIAQHPKTEYHVRREAGTRGTGKMTAELFIGNAAPVVYPTTRLAKIAAQKHARQALNGDDDE